MDVLFRDHERFLHKEGGPGKFLCASYSAGGNFAAFAGSQKTIYIYMLDVQSVRCIATLKDIHTDSIDTMAWSHRGLKFVTGAHDGRLFVWDFKFNSWKGQELKLLVIYFFYFNMNRATLDHLYLFLRYLSCRPKRVVTRLMR